VDRPHVSSVKVSKKAEKIFEIDVENTLTFGVDNRYDKLAL